MTDNLNLGTIDLGTDDEFIARHIGPRAADTQAMLQRLGYDSLDTLIGNVIPDSIKGSSVLQAPVEEPHQPGILRLPPLPPADPRRAAHPC